ncbi:hypothetical protein QO004_005364 [Rhizobium mesoamericanum]|nr:hypothetical protein [Rhizobium mesoamericanum]
MQDRKLSFHGAAGSFTSPCFLPEVAGFRIVIGCGLFCASPVEHRFRFAPERLGCPDWQNDGRNVNPNLSDSLDRAPDENGRAYPLERQAGS